MTTRPPRRATVSAMRRPAMAVMLATTSGIVVPVPSGALRSTSCREPTALRLGTMNTSSYVRSYGGWMSLRNSSAECPWASDSTTGTPSVRFGTKWLSMTST
ncbi:hypothetical protein SALBM311S_05223 [Streptomyces alboniger]